MHKKFEINQTKIKGGCQSGRKVVTHNSKSDLLLGSFRPDIRKLFYKNTHTCELRSKCIQGGCERELGVSTNAFATRDRYIPLTTHDSYYKAHLAVFPTTIKETQVMRCSAACCMLHIVSETQYLFKRQNRH